ncbi:Lipopolysaccharide export system ATP-binding protein LptB [Roseobacter fucihabitans]|uniref:Lipopolysaccharide export system ATP-binding protein LptB n=1 Tax=Roseobacter fucihabitans TaxID=1537242 RepID=A0ABZ2C0I4_9RHOB|nr:ABC transporter ATP-binding protein [Roseobacter litoralis]MBC6964937.1 Lipopolysaccharide export system ATP-binding protein LptB [Roseobacter litoralis]
MGDAILSTLALTCDFGPFRAVDNVSIRVARGSITGLIGPNGAGKSTFFNAITGNLKPTSGTVELDGADITGQGPDRLFLGGMGRAFQIPRPFGRMSVLENVMLAPVAQIGERLWGPFLSRKAVRAQEEAIRTRAMEMLEFMTLGPLADHPAGKISGGQMKLLELARVLMGDPKVILLDEPAAGVNPTLTGTLIEKIEALNATGKTFVIIEHDMDFIMRHCNPIIALAEGRVVFEGSAEEAQNSEVLRNAYLGAPVDA